MSLVAAALLPGAARGVALPAPVLRIERVDTSAPPRLRLFVTELDQTGQVPPLFAPAFVSLSVDGNKLVDAAPRVETFSGVGEALAVELVVQLSPAIEDAFPEIQRGLSELVGGLTPSSRIGVVGYADVVVVQKPPAAPAAARSNLGALEIKKDALEVELPDGVRAALGALTGPTAADLPRRRVVVVVSDGITAHFDPTDFNRLAAQGRDAEVSIHTVGYSKFDDSATAAMLNLSRGSRGTPRSARTGAELNEALKALSAELRLQRVVDVEVPQLFDGRRHDFQLEVSGRATEPVRADLPASTLARENTFKPIILAFFGFLILGGLAGSAVLLKRRRHATAEAILREAMPETSNPRVQHIAPEPPSELDPTMLGLRPVHAPVPPLPGGEPSVQLFRASLGGDPSLVMLASDLPPLLEPSKLSDPIDAAGIPLPSPTQFLRRATGDAEQSRIESPTIRQPRPEFACRPDRTVPPTLALDPALKRETRSPPGAQEQTAGSALKPSQGPSPSSDFADSTFGRVMKRTQILSPREVGQDDRAAWIAVLEGDRPTLLLHSGFTIGGPGADRSVQPVSGRPSEARFLIDGLGRWVLVAGGEQSLLFDNQLIQVGASTFLFKLASRFPPEVTVRRPFLQVIGGLDEGRTIELDEETAKIIGAHPSADGVVRGVGVASRHIAVRLEGGRCWVADLGSQSGFGFEGTAVSIAKLAPGQEIELGQIRLVFQVPH